MKKIDEDHFIGGPWPHQAGGYEIKYQLNGKKRSEYRKDKREAEIRCEYWKKTLSPGAPAEDHADEHTVHFWERLLRDLAIRLLADPENKAIQSAARSLSALAAEGLKTARYQPPPPQKSADTTEAVDPSKLNNMTSQELANLLGGNN